MCDRQLVEIAKNDTTNADQKNIVMSVLLKRYERQLYKNWYRLDAQMNNSDLVASSKDEYFSEAREAFYTAIQKVDLDRIEDDNWKLVGMVNWYLANVRSKIIKNLRKDAKIKPVDYMQSSNESNLSSSASVDPDVEEAYWSQEGYKTSPEYALETEEAEKRCKKALNTCLASWDNTELIIYRGLLAKKSKKELASELGWTVTKVYPVVRKMKDDLKKCLCISN